MLRLRLLLGASCSFCLRIWDVFDFNDVVIWLGWVIAAYAIGNHLFHYAVLNHTKAVAAATPKLVVLGNAPV